MVGNSNVSCSLHVSYPPDLCHSFCHQANSQTSILSNIHKICNGFSLCNDDDDRRTVLTIISSVRDPHHRKSLNLSSGFLEWVIWVTGYLKKEWCATLTVTAFLTICFRANLQVATSLIFCQLWVTNGE